MSENQSKNHNDHKTHEHHRHHSHGHSHSHHHSKKKSKKKTFLYKLIRKNKFLTKIFIKKKKQTKIVSMSVALVLILAVAFAFTLDRIVYVKSQEKNKDHVVSAEDEGKYGVRWEIDNPNDTGSRCLAAVNLEAGIGVGSSDGYSDFDSIYPWSEMKRCNIISGSNGSKTVIYEGEDGFALDGSNGDVFVRIPKFYVSSYVEDGYEYRVISATDGTLHSAFVENGKELGEIFISAFEGYIDNSNKLRSIANVIPTNNVTATNFLKSAKNRGGNYSLYDSRCVDAIWTLMAVEYGCRNSNLILGYGVADYLQPIDNEDLRSIKEEKSTNSITISKFSNATKNCVIKDSYITVCKGDQSNILTQAKILDIEYSSNGLYTTIHFDGKPINVDTTCFVGSAPLSTNYTETCTAPLNWHTGRAKYVSGENEKTQNPIRYRWIENVFGNVWHYLPDVTFKDLRMYVCSNMSEYSIASTTGGYKAVGTQLTEQSSNGSKADVINANFWITSLIDDDFAKDIPFGNEYNTTLLSTQAFGAYYYLNDGINIIANGGGFDHLYRCNILTQRAWVTPTTKWYLYGARLMYKDIY